MKALLKKQQKNKQKKQKKKKKHKHPKKTPLTAFKYT